MEALQTLQQVAARLLNLDAASAAELTTWLQAGGLTSLKTGLLALPIASTPEVKVVGTTAAGIVIALAYRLQTPTPTLRQWLLDGGLESLTPHLVMYLEAYPKLSCSERLYSPYTLGDKLGSGVEGEVFKLCSPIGICDRVLKVNLYEHRQEGEGFFADKAAELGIGPTVYKYALCPKDNSTVAYIVAKRLSGPILGDIYPFKIGAITQALDLYYKLLIEAQIAQNDLKPTNIMYDGERLYIIDYGIAKMVNYTGDRVSEHMISIGNLLLNSSTGAAKEYHVPTLWSNDTDKVRKTQNLIALYNETKAWFAKHLPGTVRAIRAYGFSYDELDFSVAGINDVVS